MIDVKKIVSVSIVASVIFPALALAQTPAGQGAQVYIIAPANGATVKGPVVVQFGLKGMGVAPAGIEFPDTGHHHVVVDRELPPLTDYLPTDDPKIVHFGKGQTETTLKLEPGTHTLQLVFADQDHRPHVPPVVSEKITITVQ